MYRCVPTRGIGDTKDPRASPWGKVESGEKSDYYREIVSSTGARFCELWWDVGTTAPRYVKFNFTCFGRIRFLGCTRSISHLRCGMVHLSDDKLIHSAFTKLGYVVI
jgi:hypothetical protein